MFKTTLAKRTHSHLCKLLLVLLATSLAGCGAEQERSNNDKASLSESVENLQSASPQKQNTAAALPIKAPQDQAKLSTKKIRADSEVSMVYISAGAIQCEFSGHALEKTAEGLEQGGISIINAHCGNMTGVMMAAVCGGATTRINLYEIASEDLDAALRAGYKSVDALARGDDMGFAIGDCPVQ